MRNICFIPLRKGSKGIPNKNIKLFNGKELFCWSLDIVINSGLASEIWIATDCETVKSIVRTNYSSIYLFERSSTNAQDDSPTIDVILEFLSQKNYSANDRLILFQATSPLTSLTDISLLKQMIEKNEYDSLLACLRLKRFRWTDNGEPLDYSLNEKPRRQEYSGFLIETGSFYMSSIGHILRSKHLLSGRIGIVEVESQAIVDIDEPIDWYLGEAYAAYLNKLK